ncbi:MAG: DNA polymerase/3'-5' exonuclease PolX [Solirubrobacteraceae bacterium]|nr:DNA polymerase/3'-5' exonuclease PolX [Solirubrobacteraceae bacterium]
MAPPRDPSNAEIALVLEELADRYELDGAIAHRVLAYRNAADAVRSASTSIAAQTRAGTVTEIPGIGKTLEEKLGDLLDTGTIPALEKLRAKIPDGLLVLTRVPGLGAKRIAKLHKELGVDGPPALKVALEAGTVADLKGFGPSSAAKIAAALEAAGDSLSGGPERVLLPRALEIGEALRDELRAHPASDRVELAGSARRRAESVHDLDLIATSTDVPALVDAFAASELMAEVKSRGDNGAHGMTQAGLAIDLRIVPPAQFGNLLQHFTGSKAHNVALRTQAQARGIRVSERGILNEETGELTRCATEEEVYETLGLTWVPPELREDRGELQLAAGEVPELIELADLRGDLHLHSTKSDGRGTIEEMAQAAIELGHEYLVITDHSASHGFGNHVTAEELERTIAEVRELNAQLGDGFTLLAGSEVNIGVDGSLDYPDELLAELDWVVASVHTAFTSDPTARIVAACEHPSVDLIGHPTGRMIEKRAPYDLDVTKVIEVAAATGTFLEINGSPRRRDLSEIHAREAARRGVKLVIDSDAHGPEVLTNLQWGIATARRAWLTAGDVANTRPWAELRELRKGGR